MTNPKRSFKNEFGRFYNHPSMESTSSALGSLVAQGRYQPNPSITNIMKQHDEGFLPGFYAKQVAEFAADNLDSLVEQRDKFGRDVVFGQLRAIPDRQHPNAAIGDNVHDAINSWCIGEPIPPLLTTTAENMFLQWLRFVKVYQPQIERSEYTVWSYEHGYAGTGDLLWIKDGERWVIDVKSGVRVQPKVAMQNAAIKHADVILADEEGQPERPMPKIDKLGVLHVRPRSIKLYELERTDEAWSAFLGCKALFDWVRFDQQLTLGEPKVKTEASKDEHGN